MTAQIKERLIYQDEEYPLCSTPLDDYFSLSSVRVPFYEDLTCLSRGYIGTWEIKGRRLYLIKLQRRDDDDENVLSSIFPGFNDRVFAHWYNGIVRVPQGKMLEYVHGGFESTFESDAFLTIEKGILTEGHIRENERGQAATEARADSPYPLLPLQQILTEGI